MQNKNQNIYIIIDAKKYKIKIYMQKSKTQKIETHKTCEPSPTNFYKNWNNIIGVHLMDHLWVLVIHYHKKIFNYTIKFSL